MTALKLLKLPDRAELSRRKLLRGGLSLSARSEPRRVDILIRGDTIEAVQAVGEPVPDDCVVIDATELAIIPGLINAHTHGHGGLSKGSGDRWTLELLLNAGGWLGGNRMTTTVSVDASDGSRTAAKGVHLVLRSVACDAVTDRGWDFRPQSDRPIVMQACARWSRR